MRFSNQVLGNLPPHFFDGHLTHSPFEFAWDEAMQPHVAWCCLALFLSGILCSAAGVGGGGVYVSVMMVIGMLTPHNAVPLSKAVVFFGAISSFGLNMTRLGDAGAALRPKAGINFDTVRVVAPAALAGTFVGVLLNWHAEGYLIVILLSGLLTFMTYMVARTAWNQYHEEVRAEAAGEAVGQSGGSSSSTGAPAAAPAEDQLLPAGSEAEKLGVEVETYSWTDAAISLLLLAIVVIGGVLRFHTRACELEVGGKHQIEGACDHWLLEVLFGEVLQPWLRNEDTATTMKHLMTTFPLAACFIVCLVTGYQVHTEAGWSFGSVAAFQVVAVVTGLFAGLVGVGGGLIFSPFFLLVGMDPASAVATSSTCVLFTSTSTTLQYMFTDRLIMSLVIVYGLVTAIASYIGTRSVHVLQDTFKGKRSYVTIVVAVAVAASAGMSYFELASILKTGAKPAILLAK